MIRILGAATVLAVMAVSSAARAQSSGPPEAAVVPQCSAQAEGTLSCQANRQCECTYFQAVPARGLPARWRWDCSILRAQCDVVPESASSYHGDLPAAVGIDRSREAIIIRQNGGGPEPDGSN